MPTNVMTAKSGKQIEFDASECQDASGPDQTNRRGRERQQHVPQVTERREDQRKDDRRTDRDALEKFGQESLRPALR